MLKEERCTNPRPASRGAPQPPLRFGRAAGAAGPERPMAHRAGRAPARGAAMPLGNHRGHKLRVTTRREDERNREQSSARRGLPRGRPSPSTAGQGDRGRSRPAAASALRDAEAAGATAPPRPLGPRPRPAAQPAPRQQPRVLRAPAPPPGPAAHPTGPQRRHLGGAARRGTAGRGRAGPALGPAPRGGRAWDCPEGSGGCGCPGTVVAPPAM